MRWRWSILFQCKYHLRQSVRSIDVGRSFGWFVCEPVAFDLAGNNLLSTESILFCLTLDCANSIDYPTEVERIVHSIQSAAQLHWPILICPLFGFYYYYFLFLRFNYNVSSFKSEISSREFRIPNCRFKHTIYFIKHNTCSIFLMSIPNETLWDERYLW